MSVKEKKIVDMNMFKLYSKYLVPTMISMVMYSAYIFGDMLFVAKGVGKTGLAALNISLPIFTMFSTFALMLGVGGAVTTTILKNEGKLEESKKTFTLIMVTNLVISLSLMAFMFLNTEKLAIILGSDEAILPYSVQYIFPIIFSVPFYFVNGSMTILVRADGNPKLAMTAGLIGNFTNIILDWLLVMYFDMGIFGAGLATSISTILNCCIILLHFTNLENTLKFTKNFFDIKLLFRIMRNGFGAAILEVSTGLTIFLTNRTLMDIGNADSVAIYTVLSNTSYIAKNLFSGVAQSAQPLISSYSAKKEYDNLNMITRIGLLTALTIGLITTIVMSVFGKEVITFFVSAEPNIIREGVPAVRIFYSLFGILGMNTLIMYFFQSMEKALLSLSVSFLRGILFIIIGLMILPNFFGVTGVWLTTPVAEGICFLMYYPMVKKIIHTLKNGNKNINLNLQQQ